MQAQTAPPVGSPELLERLGHLCSERGLENLAERMAELYELVGPDLQDLEVALKSFPRPNSLVSHSAHHLLEVGGKRLRPLCVALASRAGSGFGPEALDLAVSVELVHNATLLHDDVVDLADARRGASTARTEYGNAASIFAGDWLLIEALRRVRRSGVPGALERLFSTVEEMIFAEALQLENRGRLDTGRKEYFEVAEGKTAALFRWAMWAGGRAGGLTESLCEALESYGRHLGVAFQVIDDLLDLTGDRSRTGKALFTDLREGQMTYPLILALERDPSLRLLIREIVKGDDGEAPAALCEEVADRLRAAGAADRCRELAQERAALAVAALDALPDSRARAALVTVAESTVSRRA